MTIIFERLAIIPPKHSITLLKLLKKRKAQGNIGGKNLRLPATEGMEVSRRLEPGTYG